jgi:hypothetical protein
LSRWSPAGTMLGRETAQLAERRRRPPYEGGGCRKGGRKPSWTASTAFRAVSLSSLSLGSSRLHSPAHGVGGFKDMEPQGSWETIGAGAYAACASRAPPAVPIECKGVHYQGAMAVNAGVQTLQRRGDHRVPAGDGRAVGAAGRSWWRGGFGPLRLNQGRERSDPRNGRGSESFGRPFRLSANRLREHIVLLLCGPCGPGLWAWPDLRSTRFFAVPDVQPC